VRLVADSGGVIGAAVGGLLLCAEANVVATDHLYPRALLNTVHRQRRTDRR